MNKLIPPRADRYPLSCFIALLLLLSIVACAMPLWAHALYLAWVIVGVAALVKERVEPGLPSTLRGNVRRILRAHVWPLYMA
ncbi:conserved hypothetical protein [Paraburkholderia tropica]|nr:conserved hypothetical protein [Paraburkholderia tropica]